MARKTRTARNSHDFKYAKTNVLKRGARRHSLRRGTRGYNAYVYGTVSRRMAAKRRTRKGK